MNAYREDLLADLKDLGYATEYLTAARKESREAFLLALRDVADAQKGITSVATQAGVNRENLYRMLSEEGNPRLSSLDAILGTLGVECCFIAGLGHATQEPEVAPELSPRRRRVRLARGVKPHVKRSRRRRHSSPAIEREPAGPDVLFRAALPEDLMGLSSVPGGNNAMLSAPWPVVAGNNAIMRGSPYAN